LIEVAPGEARRNVAAEMAERALGAKYPAVNVYCEKIVNGLRGKNSGRSRGTVQDGRWSCGIRRTGWRGLQDRLEVYVDARDGRC